MSAINSKLDLYLLSKSKMSFHSNNVAKHTMNGNDLEKLQSTTDEQPQKSGEMFRNKSGKFWFTFAYCVTVSEICQDMMDHINSHFDENNSFSSPEFITIDEVESENIIETTNASDNGKGGNILKSEPFTDRHAFSGNCELVRIIKLRPIKVRPRLKTYANETKTSSNGHHKNTLTKPAEVKNIDSQLDVKTTVDNPVSKYKKYVRVPVSRCYQYEMEPRIYEPFDPRRHICLFCEIWFPNHAEFQLHVQNVHNKDANTVMWYDFYCYVCEKKFPFRSYLTNHLKVHVSTSEHLCETCGQQFKTHKSLQQHMEKHSDQTYECGQCNKVFKRFKWFREHLWLHNTNLPFVCEVCSKAFKVKRYLDRHMAIHDDPKINCRYCDASFHFVSVRRAHEKSRHNVV